MQFDLSYVLQYIPTIFKDGFIASMELSIVSFLLACVFSVFIALIRIYKIPVLNQIFGLYLSFFRGTPLMVQILIFYYGLPIVLNSIIQPLNAGFDAFDIAAMPIMIVCFTLCYSAYLSENMRSAILAVPHGQLEAGYSMGMSNMKVIIRIVAPQAFVVALPNLGNSLMDIIKMSSLAFVASVTEILGAAKIIAGRSYRYFEAYVAAAIIYWIICIIVSWILKFVEKRIRRHERNVY